MRIPTVIVDDEAPICDEIEYLLGQFTEVAIVGKFNNAFDAMCKFLFHSNQYL